ncbi:MAG: sulfatase [Bryobacteraceae bacterium]|nr:sulfatase [Bryobacteraceae bacterium]
MNRRHFLGAPFAAAPMLAQSRRQKNVLLLIADDLGLHTGAYGDRTAQTPNLDRLASEGVLFNNAFCTTASCSASRSVILSGLQNHANGQYGHAHGEHHMAYLPPVKPFPSLLKDAGYRTGYMAKLHVEPEARFRWDMAKPHNGRSVHEMAGFARQFIQSAGSQNWYLHVGFTDPHRAAKGFANQQYPGVKWNPFDPAKVKVPSYLPDSQPVREEVAEYYQAANRLDQGIGFFLDVLKETGQLDNTLVIFMSDNGMPFANAKTNCYDAGMHLPLIVRSPGQSRRGIRNNAMVNWTCIAPTILDWAGANGPGYPLHGRSFLPVLEQENPTGWDEVHFSHTFHEITMYYPMRGMRNRRYKYIRNLFPELEFPHASDLWASKTWQDVLKNGDRAMVGGRPVGKYLHRTGEELYDITADPDELNNLAGAAPHQAALEEMRRKVTAYRRETRDPWMILSQYKGEKG